VPADPALGAVFAALADDTRRSILATLAARGGATATELAAEAPITRQAMSKHLVVLADAGLVAPSRAGRETRYRVVAGSLRPAGDWIAITDAAWSRRLGRLQQHLGTARPPGDGSAPLS
jgi:DNA-binding transcriptional ArsR family regulator